MGIMREMKESFRVDTNADNSLEDLVILSVHLFSWTDNLAGKTKNETEKQRAIY